MVLCVNGFGSAVEKITKYELLVGNGRIQHGGLSCSTGEDDNFLPLEEVLERDPTSMVVTYK